MTNIDTRGELPLMAEVNAFIYELHGSLDLGYSDFFCECGDLGCRERITLTRADYARLREESRPVMVAAHAHRASSASPAAGERTDHVRPAQLQVQGAERF